MAYKGRTVSVAALLAFAMLMSTTTTANNAYAVGGQDLAVTNYFASTTSILLGDGTGNFDPRVPYPSGGGSAFVAVGDFNEDGNEDLAVANNIFGSNKIAILIGNGDGTFNAPILVNSAFSAGVIAVADYNNDAHQDLGVTTSSGGLTVNFGDGTGNFSGANSIATGPGGTGYVVTGDFDKDGNADLVTTKVPNAIAIVLGDGTGSFGAPATFANSGGSNFVVVGDFNGDENADIATNAGSKASVFLGNGDGTFGAEVLHDAGPVPTGLAVGNFDGPSVPPNTAPDVSNAQASTTTLWPPNNKMVPITVEGVTDADGNEVTITITSIMQDEKTGNEADASGVGTDTASVRSERDGKGDGRVYHIFFTADDGNGGVTAGEVTVDVPHDQSGAPAVDGGALYDSTQSN